MNTKEYSRHYEQSAIVKANPETVFAYADDHANFSCPEWIPAVVSLAIDMSFFVM